MRGASGVSAYVGLPEQEASDIEYWLLEEAKLQRLPKAKALEGRVALITGGAGGIGQAVARRLLTEGAHVVLSDRDQTALDDTCAALGKAFGGDKVRGVVCDVRDESSVAASMACTAAEFGGLDILVSNAGIAWRRRSKRPRCRRGRRTWTSSRPATSWSGATPSPC